MPNKKIKCVYINNENIIRNYIRVIKKQNNIPIFCLMLIFLIFGIYGFITNPTSKFNSLWIGIAIYIGFSEIYSSHWLIAKRQAKRYKKKYGLVNTKVEITLSDKVHYSIDKKTLDYKWLSIVNVKETDDLLIISYPNEVIPLKKNSIQNATLEETREFIRNHIIESKDKKEKEKIDQKERRKAIRIKKKEIILNHFKKNKTKS